MDRPCSRSRILMGFVGRAATGAALAVVMLVTGSAESVLPTPRTLAQDEADAETRAERRERRQSENRQADDAGGSAANPAAGSGDDAGSCIDFATQEEAQQVLDDDPADPFNLDPNGDGIACSSLPSAADADSGGAATEDAADNRPRNRDRRAEAGQTAAERPATCETLTQEEAQALLDADPSDPQGLDPDGDGIACETDELAPAEDANADRRERRARNRGDAQPADTAASPADLDCANFSFQEEAQLVLDDLPADPYNLDPNDDGFACTSLPTRAVTVNSVPSTGVGALPAALGATGALLAAATLAAAARGRGGRVPRPR